MAIDPMIQQMFSMSLQGSSSAKQEGRYPFLPGGNHVLAYQGLDVKKNRKNMLMLVVDAVIVASDNEDLTAGDRVSLCAMQNISGNGKIQILSKGILAAIKEIPLDKLTAPQGTAEGSALDNKIFQGVLHMATDPAKDAGKKFFVAAIPSVAKDGRVFCDYELAPYAGQAIGAPRAYPKDPPAASVPVPQANPVAQTPPVYRIPQAPPVAAHVPEPEAAYPVADFFDFG